MDVPSAAPDDSPIHGSISVQTVTDGTDKGDFVIKGEDSEGIFEVIRRSKDFVLLRKLLQIHFPGLYFPSFLDFSLPTDTPEDALERKRLNFESFLYRIMSISSLFHSRAVRLFLYTGPFYDKTVGNVKSPAYQTLSDEFLRAFPGFIKETEINYMEMIEKEMNSLKTAKLQAENIKKMGKRLKGFFENLMESSERMNKCFETYEADVLSECARSEPGNYRPIYKRLARKPSTNPYTLIQTWGYQEDSDLTSMLEALSTVTNLHTELTRLENKRRSDSKDLDRLHSGKFTLGSLLSLQTKSNTILELEADLRWVRVR